MLFASLLEFLIKYKSMRERKFPPYMFVLPSLLSLLQCTELGMSGLGICETVLYD